MQHQKKNTNNKKDLCSWVVPLPLCGPSVYVSVSQSECLESSVQSHCLGAQMHIQSCVLCSLNSVNPSAVPKLRTQASPVFLPISRIFALSRWTSSQHNFHSVVLIFHWKSSSSFSVCVFVPVLNVNVFDKTCMDVMVTEEKKFS